MGNWELSDDKSLPGEDKQLLTHKKYDLVQIYGQNWKDCRTGGGEGFSYGITSTRIEKNTGKPSVITLCDQFLKILTKRKYKATAKLGVSTWQKIKDVPRKKIDSKDWPRNPIDIAALLDVVLLHELTHASIALIKDPFYPKTLSITWDQSPPGWKESVRIKDPRNAESLAFFGLEVWMLKQNPPRYVSEEGDISDTRSAKMKRSLLAFNGILWQA